MLKISEMPHLIPQNGTRFADAPIPKIGSVRSEKIEIPREKNAEICERACESAVIPVIARPSVIRSGMRHSRNAPFDHSTARRKGSLIFDDDATVPSASAKLTFDIGRSTRYTLGFILATPNFAFAKSNDASPSSKMSLRQSSR